jgi:hypothetical protein
MRMQTSGLRDDGDGTWTAWVLSENYTGTRAECEWWLLMNDRDAPPPPPPLRERLKVVSDPARRAGGVVAASRAAGYDGHAPTPGPASTRDVTMRDLSELAAAFGSASEEARHFLDARGPDDLGAQGLSGPEFEANEAANALAYAIVIGRRAHAAWIDGRLYVVTVRVDPGSDELYWTAGDIFVLEPGEILAVAS